RTARVACAPSTAPPYEKLAPARMATHGTLGHATRHSTSTALLVRPFPELNVRLAHHRLQPRIAGVTLEAGRARGTDEHKIVVRRARLIRRRRGTVGEVAPGRAAGRAIVVGRFPREAVVAYAGTDGFAEALREVERTAASLRIRLGALAHEITAVRAI